MLKAPRTWGRSNKVYSKKMIEKENIAHYLDKRIFSFYNEAQQILNGEMPLPRMVIFHPNYICNYNCISCDFREQNNSYRIFMDKEGFNHMLSELLTAKIKALEFSGGGEPLLNPNIEYMMSKLWKKNISIGFLTNGKMLEGGILKKIVRYSTYIRISLDAGSNSVFMKVKGISEKKEFSIVLKNIKKAINYRRKIKSDVDISLKFAINRYNHMDLEKAIKLAIKLKVDSIQFSMYRNAIGSINNNEDIIKKMEKLKRRYSNKVQIITNIRKTKLKERCWLNSIQTTVDAFGDVYLCPYYRHRIKEHLLGNILKEKFLKVWYSKKHFDMIKHINIEKCNLYDCRFHRYNNLMLKMIKKGRNRLSFI